MLTIFWLPNSQFPLISKRPCAEKRGSTAEGWQWLPYRATVRLPSLGVSQLNGAE